jgi:hypothetical protein
MLEVNIMAEGLMAGPDGTYLRFSYDSKVNEAASRASGRSLYDNVLIMDIISPGQKVSQPRFEIERVFSNQSRAAMPALPPVKRSIKYDEYAKYIEQYKAQEAGSDLGGTPLKMWPRMDRPTVAMLAAVNIFTVEALAGINDTGLQNLGMGARELREQAKAWLENANDTGGISKYIAENETLKDKVAELQDTNRNLTALLDTANREITKLNKKSNVI